MKNRENFSYLPSNKKPSVESPENYSSKYCCLWEQAALYYFRGADEYKRLDYFGYPKNCWSRNAMKKVAGQIANEMRGDNSVMPIHVQSLVHVFQSLCMLHFEISSFEMVDFENKIIKIWASHMIDHEGLVVYFRIETR